MFGNGGGGGYYAFYGDGDGEDEDDDDYDYGGKEYGKGKGKSEFIYEICEICGQQFDTNKELKAHKKHDHPFEEPWSPSGVKFNPTTNNDAGETQDLVGSEEKEKRKEQLISQLAQFGDYAYKHGWIPGQVNMTEYLDEEQYKVFSQVCDELKAIDPRTYKKTQKDIKSGREWVTNRLSITPWGDLIDVTLFEDIPDDDFTHGYANDPNAGNEIGLMDSSSGNDYPNGKTWRQGEYEGAFDGGASYPTRPYLGPFHHATQVLQFASGPGRWDAIDQQISDDYLLSQPQPSSLAVGVDRYLYIERLKDKESARIQEEQLQRERDRKRIEDRLLQEKLESEERRARFNKLQEGYQERSPYGGGGNSYLEQHRQRNPYGGGGYSYREQHNKGPDVVGGSKPHKKGKSSKTKKNHGKKKGKGKTKKAQGKHKLKNTYGKRKTKKNQRK